MKKFLITYDLIKPIKDYEKLISKLTKMGATKELLSAWSISSDKTCEQLLAELRPFHDADDKIKVFEFVDRADYPARLSFDFANLLANSANDKPKTDKPSSAFWNAFMNEAIRGKK